MNAEELRRRCKADVVTVFAYAKETDRFTLPVGIGLLDESTFQHPFSRPRTDRLAGQVLRSGELRELVSNGLHTFLSGPFARRERVRACLVVPVVDQGPRGLLFVSFRRPKSSFGPDEHEEARRCARRMAAELRSSGELLEVHARQELERQAADRSYTLQAFVRLVCDVTSSPVAFWIHSPKEHRARIRAWTGVPVSHAESPAVEPGDGSAVGRVLAKGTPMVLPDSTAMRRAGLESVHGAGLECAAYQPVFVDDRISGVIEVLGFDGFEDPLQLLDRLRSLARMASVTVENHLSNTASRQLRQLATRLSGSADLDKALQEIVEAARKITQADSAVLYLLDRAGREFIPGAESPEGSIVFREGSPRPHGGLTRSILEKRVHVRIDDTTKDERVKASARDAARSLVGIPLFLGREALGVLYVHGRKPRQFVPRDVELLETVAGHCSVALGGSRLLLKHAMRIDKVAEALYDQEQVLESVCTELQHIGRREDGAVEAFDYVAVQLIRPDDQVIETIFGTGEAKRLAGTSKHPLARRRQLRDIQADIVRTTRIEVIAGWDPRFDRHVYEGQMHASHVRVFVPLLLFRDEAGRIQTDQTSRCRIVRHSSKRHEHGLSRSYRILPPDGTSVGAIGTLEAGYSSETLQRLLGDGAFELGSRAAVIDEARARAFGLRALELSPRIHSTTLQAVLEEVVDRARRMSGADSATLHLGRRVGRRYSHEAASGSLGRAILEGYPPRRNGLGRESIQTQAPRVVRGQSLKEKNPRIHAEGIRSLAAFPLLAGSRQGVLYLHSRRSSEFTDSDVAWVQMLARRASESVRRAVSYAEARDRQAQLLALHSVSRHISAPPTSAAVDDGYAGCALLGPIASSAVNVFAADVVTIYEYDPVTQRFRTPPAIAGRLLKAARMQSELGELDAPRQVARHGTPVFASRSVESPILNNPRRDRAGGDTFVARERIRSSVGLSLEVGQELVGVMFVNYRRDKSFSSDERDVFEAFALGVALAIKNRWLVTNLADIPRLLAMSKVEELLQELVKQAGEVSGAESVSIWSLDEGTASFELRASTASGARSKPRLQAAKPLLRTRPCLLENVALVPLLNRDGRVSGLLEAVGGSSTLNRSHLYFLEHIGTTAAIGIERANEQARLKDAEAVAILNNALPEVHHLKGTLYALQASVQTSATLLAGLNGSAPEGAAAGAPQKELHLDPSQAAELLRAAYLSGEMASQIEKLVDSFDQLPRVDAVREVHLLTCLELSRQRAKHSEGVVLSIPDGLPTIRADPHLLSHVFSSLVENAIAAGASEVLVRGSMPRPGLVELSVEDDGPGIPEPDRQRVFDFGVSSGRGGHWGLGLWWTRAYIEQLGGSVTLGESAAGGCTFLLTLPAHGDDHD